jgi:glycosyltransferase involved in cell wall biosynthesis
MKKLLSITLPTYNRAADLDCQLAWLAQDIIGFEQECEVIIYDNCSTDHTPEIIEKWRSVFADTTYRTHRNPQNVSGVPNIAISINAAQGEFVWTVSDDDPIKASTLAAVISLLKDNPDIAMLYLNFTGWNVCTNEAVEVPGLPNGQWLDGEFAAIGLDGKTVFEHCLEQNNGSLIFMTAMVYRTEVAQEAIEIWPNSIHNWGGPGFWAGYCATKGRMMITPETYIQCLIGVSYWEKERDSWFKAFHRDVPELYIQLQEKAGYSKEFCRHMIFKCYKEITGTKITSIGHHVRVVKKWPRFAVSLVSALLF